MTSLKSQETLFEAVESLVRTFAKHMRTFGQVASSLSEALEEFWKLKTLIKSDPETDEAHLLDKDNVVEYEWHGNECYILLPGGSCFATQHDTQDHNDARHDAARIALMNSFFNEHPSRKVTTEFIRDALKEVDIGSPRMVRQQLHQFSLEGYRWTLEFMHGKGMLEYQEFSNVLRLLSWSGCLSALKDRGTSRTEVFEHYSKVNMDGVFRRLLADGLMEKEQECPGFLDEELRVAEEELLESRLAGRELRFPFEKLHACLMALTQFSCD